ncbi:F0F1 ATP synthase subunit delta [Candidatus Wolfebacteria bacterium]|nr:F0F1 ATP synthase subunit delta [Candidatus Wolfebacteria bacterium]
MKYRSDFYAKALFAATEKNPEETENIIRRFFRLLKKTGDISQSRKILESVEKLAVKKSGDRWVKIEYSRSMDKRMESNINNYFGSGYHVENVINPLLIAGVRITIDDEEELDISLAKKLRKMFSTAIHEY